MSHRHVSLQISLQRSLQQLTYEVSYLHSKQKSLNLNILSLLRRLLLNNRSIYTHISIFFPISFSKSSKKHHPLGEKKRTLHLRLSLSLHLPLQRISHLLLQLPRLLGADLRPRSAIRQQARSCASRLVRLCDLASVGWVGALLVRLPCCRGAGGEAVL